MHADIGIDYRQLADVRRIVREIQARAEADFQHAPIDMGEQLLAMKGNLRIIQEVVAKARENDPRVESQCEPLEGGLKRRSLAILQRTVPGNPLQPMLARPFLLYS